VLDRNGAPIEAAPSLRRPMAVLVAVAAAGDRGIPRDKLLALLWPESSDERARHSLTQAIYNARRVTGLDDLFLTHGVLRVNPDLVSSDIADFETALRDCDLERIVELYTGPFLDGFHLSDSPEFDQWVMMQRARFEENAVSSLDELAERAHGEGRYRDAAEWRRRLAALRPLDSVAAAGLVSALARIGDRAGALRTAQEHTTALKQQLDLSPDPSFTRLLDELREPVASTLRIDVEPAAMPSPTLVVPDTLDSPIPDSARTTTPARRRFGLSRRIVAAASVVALALSAVGAWRTRLWSHESTPPTPPVPPGLLVAPFSVSGASPSIAYLGRGAAQLLAMRLDSADEDHRAIDPATLAAAWRRAGFDGVRDIPRDSVLQLADELSARRVVVGSIVGDRGRAIISATIVSLPDGEVTAHGTVEGSADSVAALTSRLATKLMVSTAGEDSLLAVRWNPPVPALCAFLSGRRQFRRAAYLDAARDFRTALRVDSTFAPAALELARTAERVGDLDEEDVAISKAWPYRTSLSDADNAELMALAGPLYPHATRRESQLAAWGRLVSVSPRDAAAWYELGARLIREGRRVGAATANEQATVALNHALILDPGYVAARDLLAHLTMRIDSGRRLASGVAMVDTLSPLAPFLRWRAAIATHDTAELGELRHTWSSMNRESARAIAMASQFDALGLDDGARALELLSARATTTAERVDLVLAAHSIALNTNRAADALAMTNRLQQLRPDSHGYLRLRVLDALYGGGDAQAARDAARDLEAPVDSLFRDFWMLKTRATADACVLGQWRLSRGDTTRVRAIIRLLRSADPRPSEQLVSATPSVCADLIEASLAVTTKRADALTLVDHLDELMLTSAVAGNASLYANIALSRMYTSLGQPQRALSALRRRTYMGGWPAYLATVWREETQLARATGDARRADASSEHLMSLGMSSRPVPPLPH
jgi:DNA-binding SARP family transcriptional activator